VTDSITCYEKAQSHPVWIRLNDQLDLYDDNTDVSRNVIRKRDIYVVMNTTISVFSLVSVLWDR
jgi:hypothetical protein